MKALRYFFCVVLPPLAVLMTGRIGSFFLSILLTLLGWIPGVIHAALVVNAYDEERPARGGAQSLASVRLRFGNVAGGSSGFSVHARMLRRQFTANAGGARRRLLLCGRRNLARSQRKSPRDHALRGH